MKLHMATADWPQKPKTSEARQVALMYAVLLTVMAVAQLFSFDEFVPLLATYGLPGGEAGAMVMATAMVVATVAALPFLLGMRLSLLMRVVSMGCGWLVPVLWLVTTVAAMGTSASWGLLGTVVTLPVGGWSICAVAGMAILAAWASWGQWPHLDRPHKK